MAKKKPVRESLGGDALRASLRADDAYKKYKRILASLEEKVDFDTVNKEIDNIHAGRTMRNLYGTTPGAEKISNAVLLDVRSRSRLVEIALKATRRHDTLDVVLDETRRYLIATYSEEAPRLSTKQERQTYFDQYLTRGLKLLASLKSITESANYIIKDIDQCSHSTRHLIDCLELLLSRNNDKQAN